MASIIKGGDGTLAFEEIIQKMDITARGCSPYVISAEPGICSDESSINKIAGHLGISKTKQPIKIMDEAKEKTKCATESCVYEVLSKKISSLDIESTFTNKGPWKDNGQWLDNDDIDNCQKLWLHKFPTHKHVKFMMMDFEKQNEALSKVNWDNIYKNYDTLGCVLNTDHSGSPGRHWVCIFVDIKGKTVEYFDSGGSTPPPEANKFIVQTAKTLSDISGKKYKDISVTTMTHQKSDSECGVYTLFYILSRLHGVPCTFFKHTRIPDSDMKIFRSYIFR